MRDPNVHLGDVLDRIDRITRVIAGDGYAVVVKDEARWDSIERSLEIIGEAVKGIPQNLRDTWPEIAWQRIVGLRNILIHRYHGLDTEAIWDIVAEHLPKLRTAVIA